MNGIKYRILFILLSSIEILKKCAIDVDECLKHETWKKFAYGYTYKELHTRPKGMHFARGYPPRL